MPPKGRGRGQRGGGGGPPPQQQPGGQRGQQGQGRQQRAPEQQHYQPPGRRDAPPGFPDNRAREEPQQQPPRQGPPPGWVQPQAPQQPAQQRQPPVPQQPQPQQQPPQQKPPKKVVVDPVEVLGMEFTTKLAVDPKLPRKPPPGTSGKAIRLVTNCYEVQLPVGNVYHYDVEILNKRFSTTTGEDKDSKYRCLNTKRNREVIKAMLSSNDLFRGIFLAYDGRKNAYSKNMLPFVDYEYKCNVILDAENPGNPADPPRLDTYQVVIKPVRKKDTQDCSINLDLLPALYNKRAIEVPQEILMAIETILRNSPCQRFVPVGRSFFYPPDPKDVHPLGGGKEIWFGYHQSIRLGQWKPMINLDVTATTFYESGPVLQYVADLLRKDAGQLQTTQLRDFEIHKLSKELKMLHVETTHLRNYRRKYRILRFTRDSASKQKFTCTDENGQQITQTVEKYFLQRYNLRLRYPNLPCIQGNPEKKNIYLPLEVCEVVAGQHCKKKLEEKQNAEMIKFTARQPAKRFGEIRAIKARAAFNSDKNLDHFGIKVSEEPLKLKGRVLEPPNVLYKLKEQTKKVRPRDGSWDMRENQFFRGAEIISWVLLSLADTRFCSMQSLEKFAGLLRNIAAEQGMRIDRAARILTERPDQNRNPVRAILQNIKNQFGTDTAEKKKQILIVVVVPGRDKSIYGEVKMAAETDLSITTQCIKDDSVVKKCNPPLVSNLCQKINAKMGGINNALTPGEVPEIMRRPVIIIGADVTHPGPTNSVKPSIAACVGSLDAHPSRYAVTIRAQTNVDEKKQAIETILELRDMVTDLLKAFHRSTRGKKPEKIIFYRDGVSEGQFNMVKEHEVECIRDACRKLQADYQPGITYVVVQKRHHTRFMPQDDRDGVGKMRNIPPGTTIDTDVVHPLNFDFYLCSHFGLQGTSRPGHYTVIADDNGFNQDDLQKLTYYLCHIYARCTKSISVPVPVQYAHLAAYRAMTHLTTTFGGDTSSSDTGSSMSVFKPLSDSQKNAIKVQVDLLNSMYFV